MKKRIIIITAALMILGSALILSACLTTNSTGNTDDRTLILTELPNIPDDGKLRTFSQIQLPGNTAEITKNILGTGAPEFFITTTSSAMDPGVMYKGMDQVEFSGDGNFLLQPDINGAPTLWSIEPLMAVRSYFGAVDEIKKTFFSPDGRFIFALCTNSITIWKTSSGELLETISTPMAMDASVADDGKTLLISANARLEVWDYTTLRKDQEISLVSGNIETIPGTTTFAVENFSEIELWDWKTGKQKWTAKIENEESLKLWSFIASRDGKFIYARYSDMLDEIPSVHYEISSKNGASKKIFTDYPTYERIVPHSDNRYFVVGDTDGFLRMYDMKAKKEVGELDTSAYLPEETREMIAQMGKTLTPKVFLPSPDGKWLYFHSRPDPTTSEHYFLWNLELAEPKLTTASLLYSGAVKLSDNGEKITDGINTWDVFSGKITEPMDYNMSNDYADYGRVEETYYYSAFKSDSGRYIVEEDITNPALKLKNARSDRLIRKLNGHEAIGLSAAAFSQDELIAATAAGDGRIIIWELNTGRQLKNINSEGGWVTKIIIAPDKMRLYAQNITGSIHCYEIKTGKYLGSFSTIIDGWITKTSKGYFIGKTTSDSLLKVRMGNNVLPIDSFYDQFYNPIEVAATFSSGTPRQQNIKVVQPTKSIQDITIPPPNVSLYIKQDNGSFTKASTAALNVDQSELTIRVEATSSYGKIGEIKIRNNGKIMDTDVRGLARKEETDRVIQDFVIPLVEGGNRITAVALSEQLIESSPAGVTIAYTPPAPVAPDMYVLAVGIDEYKNGRYSLDYAVGDVEGFISSLTPIADSLYDELFISEIKNEKAVRTNIISELESIAAKAMPEDVFVFYYAGHGIALTDSGKNINSEFYYVLHDVTQMTRPDKIREGGISGTEIREFFKKVPAMKQVAMIDACNSGAFAESFAYRGAAEEQALARLSRATGSAIIAATRNDQFAAELEALGHGAFTMAVIEALEGKAATSKKQITASSVRLYLDDRLPEITEEYSGSEQYPISFIYGQDFPIGIVK